VAYSRPREDIQGLADRLAPSPAGIAEAFPCDLVEMAREHALDNRTKEAYRRAAGPACVKSGVGSRRGGALCQGFGGGQCDQSPNGVAPMSDRKWPQPRRRAA
jgi:hypothetical protein